MKISTKWLQIVMKKQAKTYRNKYELRIENNYLIN